MMRAMRELVRHVRDVSISTKMPRIHTRTMTAVVTNVVPLGDRTDVQLIGDRMRRARSPVYLHVPVTGAELAEGVFDALVGLGIERRKSRPAPYCPVVVDSPRRTDR